MRRHTGTLYLTLLISAAVTLTACTPKGSVEQHTRHYVYASDEGFDPNFSTQKADTDDGAFFPAVLGYGSTG